MLDYMPFAEVVLYYNIADLAHVDGGTHGIYLILVMQLSTVTDFHGWLCW